MAACPNCGGKLTYVPQYDRHYCYACGQYAPKGFGVSAGAGPAIQLGGEEGSHDGHYHCPTCGNELTFIAEYDRHYCYRCTTYAPKDVAPVGEAPAATPVVPEPTTADAAPDIVAAAGNPEESAMANPDDAREQEPEDAGAPSTVEAEAANPGGNPSKKRKGKKRKEEEEEKEEEAEEEEERPPLRRSEVVRAKKAQLIEWCRAHGLNTSGKKADLRDRLLQHMDQFQVEEEGVAEEPAGAAPPAPEAVEEPAPEEMMPEAVEAPEVEAEAPAEEAPPEEPEEPEIEAAEPEVDEAVEEELLEELLTSPEPEPEPEEIVTEEPWPEEPIAEEPEVVEALLVAPEVSAPEPVPAPAVAPVAPAPPVEPAKEEKPLPCPTCGKVLTYIDQYNRLYCYSCGNYAPKDYGKEPVPPPKPEPVAVAVPAPVAVAAPVPEVLPAPEPEPVAPKAENPCPTCGEELSYIQQYDRWYCYKEKKYAAKAKNPCPTCGKELSFIEQYGRWYCYDENKYAPKTYVAAAPAAAVAVARPVAPRPAVRAEAAAVAGLEQRMTALEQGTHAHGRPSAGIALAAVGLSLFIIWFLLLPALGPLHVLGLVDTTSIFLQYGQVLSLLALIGLILATAGVLAGLAGVRRR